MVVSRQESKKIENNQCDRVKQNAVRRIPTYYINDC